MMRYSGYLRRPRGRDYRQGYTTSADPTTAGIGQSSSSMAASTDVDEPDHETSLYHRSCSGDLRTLTI